MEAKTKKRIIWAIVIIAILAIIAFYVYKYTNLPKAVINKLTGNSDFNAAGSFVGDYGDEINTDKVLFFGDKSNNVVRLQSAINEMIDKYGYNYTKLSTDGIFGAKTAAALKYISNNTLSSGNVTVNKVYNLPKLGAVTPAPITSGTPTGSMTSAPTYTSARQFAHIELPKYLYQV